MGSSSAPDARVCDPDGCAILTAGCGIGCSSGGAPWRSRVLFTRGPCCTCCVYTPRAAHSLLPDGGWLA
eukprot:4029145-Prymnesium_polylepis.1